jgi:hypothetical protein
MVNDKHLVQYIYFLRIFSSTQLYTMFDVLKLLVSNVKWSLKLASSFFPKKLTPNLNKNILSESQRKN